MRVGPRLRGMTVVGPVSAATSVIPAKAGTQYTEQRGIASGSKCRSSRASISSPANGTLYIGVTSDLPQRTSLHKQDLIDGFTKRYGVHRLVYYEMHHTMPEAILREKRLKKWNRAWKIRLIESMNPEWVDPFDEFCGEIAKRPGDIARRYIGRDRVEM
jgi:putative endonuclease